MLIPILLLLLGLALVIKGADLLVSGASALAKKMNVSDLAVGLTVVAFGTSLPELVVNSFASLEGHNDIVLGNIIGSNNFNLFIILGITALIYPIRVQSSTAWKEIPISLFAIIVFFVLANSLFSSGSNVITRFDASILMGFFIIFIFYVFKQLKKDPAGTEINQRGYSAWRTSILILIGMAMLIGGGRLTVSNAVDIAGQLGIPEKIIGLTILAAGTSLPELATSVVAAFRKNSDIAIGNVIGSNIFNIFLILSVSAFLRPVQYDAKFNMDLAVLGGGTILLLLAMMTGQRKKLDRWEAALLALAYIIYIFIMIR